MRYACNGGMAMTTPRDDIAGLSGLFELGALRARVKELEATALAKENARLKNWIDLHRGDVMSLSGDVDQFREAVQEAEARALRAEQERDEAYEHAAKVAESNDRQLEWVNDRDAYSSPTRRMQNTIAAAIRRLAAGPEKEKKV